MEPTRQRFILDAPTTNAQATCTAIIMTVYDAQNNILCHGRIIIVPEPVSAFLGDYDTGAQRYPYPRSNRHAHARRAGICLSTPTPVVWAWSVSARTVPGPISI
jgi:hypothetical protein